MRVRLSEEARTFLRAEAEYLRRRSPPAARRNLGDFPLMGSETDDGLIPGARRLVVGDYLLIYDVSEDLIDIVAIRHGRMRPPSPDADEYFDYEAKP